MFGNSAEEYVAKKAWDEIYKVEKNLPPVQEEMQKIVNLFRKRNVKKVLDLACGSGRHSLYLAEQGLEVYGIDLSEEGIKTANYRLSMKGLRASLVVGSIYKRLPYENNFFDAVICTRSIHHAKIEAIRKAIEEIERVLKPKGLFFCTVRKKKISQIRTSLSKKIAPRTHFPLEGREKGVVHYLFNKRLIRKEFKNFRIHDLWVDSRDAYYCFLGELRENPQEKSFKARLY